MIRIDRIIIDCRNSQVHFSGTVDTASVIGDTTAPFTVVIDEGVTQLDKEAWGNEDAIAAIAQRFSISPWEVEIAVKSDAPPEPEPAP